MTVKPRHIPLDELLDHIAIEEDEPSYAALSRWCELYPEHASELADYFATWAEQIELPITQSVDAERFAAEAVSHALNLLHQEESKEKQETLRSKPLGPRCNAHTITLGRPGASALAAGRKSKSRPANEAYLPVTGVLGRRTRCKEPSLDHYGLNLANPADQPMYFGACLATIPR